MCYGMGCEWECSHGECEKPASYPCPFNDKDRREDPADIADRRYHEEACRSVKADDE